MRSVYVFYLGSIFLDESFSDGLFFLLGSVKKQKKLNVQGMFYSMLLHVRGTNERNYAAFHLKSSLIKAVPFFFSIDYKISSIL